MQEHVDMFGRPIREGQAAWWFSYDDRLVKVIVVSFTVHRVRIVEDESRERHTVGGKMLCLSA